MTETVAQAAQNVSTAAKNDLTWIQKHERVVIITLVLAAAVWFGNLWMKHSASTDQVKAAVAAQQANDQKALNAQLAQDAAQAQSQYQAVIQALSTQNASLAAAVAQRNVVLDAQETADKTLPLPAIADRWKTLAALQPEDITFDGSTLNVSDTGARSTVAQLEQVPVLQQNLKDEQTIAQNTTQELQKSNDLTQALDTQITGLKTQIVDDDKKCSTQVAAVKASDRVSKRNWFLKGVGVGAAVVVYVVTHY